MTDSAEIPHNPESSSQNNKFSSLTAGELGAIAENPQTNISSEIRASITSFLNGGLLKAGLTFDQARTLFDLKADDLIKLLQDLPSRQLENAQQKSEAARTIGAKVLTRLFAFNPFQKK